MKAERMSVSALSFFDTIEGPCLRMWTWVRYKWHEWSRTQGHDGDGGKVDDTCERIVKKGCGEDKWDDRPVSDILSSQWAQHRTEQVARRTREGGRLIRPRDSK